MTRSDSTGYNWRNTLTDYASISGIIAGFCVAFIGIVLGWSIADTVLYEELTYGHIAVLLFGVSTALLIASSEFFLHAKNFDVFDLSDEYRDWLQRGFPDKNWDEIWENNHKQCQANEKYGRICYNLGIFMIFIGLFLVVAPYHLIIASIVSGLGIILELWQLRKPAFKSVPEALETKQTEEEKTKSSIRAEKLEQIRGLYIIGLLAILVSIKLSYSLNPSISVDIFTDTFLTFLISCWAIYSFLMIFGFSQDILPDSLATSFRAYARFWLRLSLAVTIAFIIFISYIAYLSNRLPMTIALIIVIITTLLYALKKYRRA